MKTIFFCINCKSHAPGNKHWTHNCSNPMIIKLHNLDIEVEDLSPLERFKIWGMQHFVSFHLPFGSAVIINAIMLMHCKWSFIEKMVESLCFGIVLMKLFNK